MFRYSKKTKDFNVFFLAKQCRKVLTQPDNLWVSFAKYFNNDIQNFPEVEKSSSSYSAWKHNLDHGELLKKGLT